MSEFYDQRFYTELAQQGKDKWSDWHKANPGIAVNFRDIDFTRNKNKVDSFLGYDFAELEVRSSSTLSVTSSTDFYSLIC